MKVFASLFALLHFLLMALLCPVMAFFQVCNFYGVADMSSSLNIKVQQSVLATAICERDVFTKSDIR